MRKSAPKYNPKMVARLLRQKKGPFIKVPRSGTAAFMKWLGGKP